MSDKIKIGDAIFYHGDCLDIMQSMDKESVHCCVTSPPYFGLRDYGHEDQIGLEDHFDDYVKKLVKVFREVRRLLRDDGTLWLNLGDSYICFNIPEYENFKSFPVVNNYLGKHDLDIMEVLGNVTDNPELLSCE